MKATRLPSGSWRCLAYCGRDEDGHQIRKSFSGPDRRRVLAEASAWVDAHRTGGRPKMVGEALEAFLNARESSLSPSTLRGYRSIQRAFKNASETILDVSVWSISAEELQRTVDKWIREGLSVKSVRNRLGLISAAVTSCGGTMPSVALPQRSEPELRIPNPDAVQALIKSTRGELWICLMLAVCGPLRRGEICALTMDDIDARHDVVHVHRSVAYKDGGGTVVKPPKTRSSDRYILVPHEVIEAIVAQGYVTRWNPRELYYRFKRALRSAGLEDFRLHDLRHYSISELLAAGVEPIYIAERSGHATLGTMRRYEHILAARRREVNETILGTFSDLSS